MKTLYQFVIAIAAVLLPIQTVMAQTTRSVIVNTNTLLTTGFIPYAVSGVRVAPGPIARVDASTVAVSNQVLSATLTRGTTALSGPAATIDWDTSDRYTWTIAAASTGTHANVPTGGGTVQNVSLTVTSPGGLTIDFVFPVGVTTNWVSNFVRIPRAGQTEFGFSPRGSIMDIWAVPDAYATADGEVYRRASGTNGFGVISAGGDTLWHDVASDATLTNTMETLVFGHDTSAGDDDNIAIDLFSTTSSAFTNYGNIYGPISTTSAQLNVATTVAGVDSGVVRLISGNATAEIRTEVNGATNFNVISASGYSGAGTLFLSDDGTYKSPSVPAGASIWTNAAGTVRLINTNQTLLLNPSTASVQPLRIVGATNQTAPLLNIAHDTGGISSLMVLKNPGGVSVAEVFSEGGLSLTSEDSSGIEILFIDGSNLLGPSRLVAMNNIDSDTVFEVSSQGITTITSGVVSSGSAVGTIVDTINVLTNGESIVEARNTGVTHFRVAGNSGYGGAGDRFLSDDGTYKLPSTSSAANWTASGTTNSLLAGSAQVHNLTATNKVTIGSGDAQQVYYPTVAQRLAVSKGTAATPDTDTNNLVKVERLINMDNTQIAGDGGEHAAALMAITVGTTQNAVQAVGLYGAAKSSSTNQATTGADDACAIYGVSRVTGAGTGISIGGFLNARRDTATASATALELSTENNTTTAEPYISTGFSRMNGIWLHGTGLTNSSAGIAFGNPFGPQFDVGIGFTSQVAGGQTGAVTTTSIRDDGSALTSIAINGIHTNAAIAVADTSGPVLVASGTLARPGIAWTGDDDGSGTGFYRSAANSFSVVVNGVENARFDVGSGMLLGAGNVRLGTEGSAMLQFGSDSATPLNQLVKAPDGSGANIAGANLSIGAGRSTGTGVGGSILLQTSPAGGAGSSQNALVTVLTIPSSGAISGRLPANYGGACSDETTALTTGTNKLRFRMPHSMTLTAVRANLTTAQTAGSILTVDINEDGTSLLSTKITIDDNETTSTTAATAPVISDTALADDAIITVDIDQVGTSPAGLKVWIIGYR